MITVEVENVRIDHPEYEARAFEVVISSESGDYSFGWYADKPMAEAYAKRLRDMFEVVT